MSVDLQETLGVAPQSLEWQAVRAQGAGGQNVNKVATAVHLRFSIAKSQLPAAVQAALLASGDRRISSGGILIIKAQRYRTQEQNRDDALQRLAQIIAAARVVLPTRVATKPSYGAKLRRLDGKARRSSVKSQRQSPIFGGE